MYDLGVPDFADEAHSQPGCIMTEEICGANEIGGGYCVHGECIADSIVLNFILLIKDIIVLSIRVSFYLKYFLILDKYSEMPVRTRIRW